MLRVILQSYCDVPKELLPKNLHFFNSNWNYSIQSASSFHLSTEYVFVLSLTVNSVQMGEISKSDIFDTALHCMNVCIISNKPISVDISPQIYFANRKNFLLSGFLQHIPFMHLYSVNLLILLSLCL